MKIKANFCRPYKIQADRMSLNVPYEEFNEAKNNDSYTMTNIGICIDDAYHAKILND